MAGREKGGEEGEMKKRLLLLSSLSLLELLLLLPLTSPSSPLSLLSPPETRFLRRRQRCFCRRRSWCCQRLSLRSGRRRRS